MARMDHNCVVVSLNQFFWLKSSSHSSNLQRLIPFLRVRHVLLTLSGSYLCGHSLFIFAVQHVKTIVSSYFYHILSFLCPWLQCPWFQCFNVHGFFIVSSHVPVTCRTRFKIILVLCLDLFLCGGSHHPFRRKFRQETSKLRMDVHAQFYTCVIMSNTVKAIVNHPHP